MTETARQEGYSVLYEKYCDRMDDEFFQCAVALLADSGSGEMLSALSFDKRSVR